MKKLTRPLAVIDFETDPFLFGRTPKPFCVEFLSDDECASFWGDDCADQLVRYLEKLPKEYMIYAHNGGRFDFHFLLKYLDNPITIINGRIVECRMFGHVLRDSFAIIPAPLRDYKKDKTDYKTFERGRREKHKAAILEYLHSDCVHLLELVWAFVEQFGPRLTIGSTSIKELIKLHPFERLNERQDAYFRPWYFGGRVQAFRSGLLPGPWEYADVNSMYPDRMANDLHPIGAAFEVGEELPDNFDEPFFAKIIGVQRTDVAPFPVRVEGGGLNWRAAGRQVFSVTSHELKAALEHDLIKIERVLEVARPQKFGNFAAFVNHWAERKITAEKAGDITGKMFAKFISNSAYGKTGQDPRHYKDYVLHRDFGREGELVAKRYEPCTDFGEFEVWQRQAKVHHKAFYNVSIAASITGAARAKLLRGLLAAEDPIYCDTDSIICKKFNGEIDPHKLGAWKIEARARKAVVCGKKLYALYDDARSDPIKLASKGGKITLSDLLSIARGKKNPDGTTGVLYEPQAPTFSLRADPRFTRRRFNMTAELPAPEWSDPEF